MKKIFTLIATALVAMGASAQTTIFSAQPTAAWDVPGGSTDVEITADYATISGGKMYVTSQQTDAKAMIKSQGGEIAFQCTNNNTFFKVVLNEALQAGDVISTRMQSRTDTELGLWFATGDRPSEAPTARIDLATAAEQAWEEAPSYTVATGDGICGETTFYIYRATGKSTYFNTFAITRGGGGGGGGTTPEVWDASTADLEAIAANPVANDNDNFFVIPQETKLYPAGTYPDNSSIVVKSDGGIPAGLKNYILIGETASIKMTGTSTPNHDASANEGWQLKANGEANANAGLNTDDCTVKFQKAIAPKNGNPSMSYKYYYEDKEDHSGASARVSEDYWTPELKQMPLKGLYYEFETKAAGELLIGIRMNRETDQLYVFTKDDFTQLPTSALSIEGFVNNNTVVWGTNEKAMSTITMTSKHNYDHGKADIAEDYIEGFPTSKAVFGYLKLNVEANKTYVMLSPKAQPAIFGFQFTPGGDPSGVETIKVEKAWNANAPMYNLSGQQVDKSYKGIVIQNGRKFVNK